MKSLAKLLLLLIIAGGGFAGWMYFDLPQWAMKSTTLNAPIDIKLAKGMRLQDFAADLEHKGIVDSGFKFRVWMRFFKDYSKFQAGPYRFEGSVSPATVYDSISLGKTFEPFELQFVIPEGFTLKQVIERLEARKVGTKAELLAIATDKALLKKYNIDGPNVEGFLYPATYSFEKMPTA
ncbi:MAG: hypothetical protein EOP10_30795, partial [Proteobacteria bacterium]